jgi:hypothetical protein
MLCSPATLEDLGVVPSPSRERVRRNACFPLLPGEAQPLTLALSPEGRGNKNDSSHHVQHSCASRQAQDALISSSV